MSELAKNRIELNHLENKLYCLKNNAKLMAIKIAEVFKTKIIECANCGNKQALSQWIFVDRRNYPEECFLICCSKCSESINVSKNSFETEIIKLIENYEIRPETIFVTVIH